jgi:hypothetical protein
MIERNVGPFQPEKHTLPKRTYQTYETYNINMEPPKPNSLEKQIRHNLP